MSVATQPPPPVSERPPDIDEIVEALRPIVRRGLPVVPEAADDRLLALRGVWARSIDPDHRLYRVQGLDRLLREVLENYPDDDGLGEAAAVLFGLALGSRGTTLTARRQRIARERNYTDDHVRKEIEPRVVRQVAWLIHLDSQTYTPRARGIPPPLAASGDTPDIRPQDLISRERLEHEEAVSMLWAHVYALRGMILRFERVRRFGVPNALAEDLAEALRGRDNAAAALNRAVDDYIEKWGERIAHGEGVFDARRLERLAGMIRRQDREPH